MYCTDSRALFVDDDLSNIQDMQESCPEHTPVLKKKRCWFIFYPRILNDLYDVRDPDSPGHVKKMCMSNKGARDLTEQGRRKYYPR